MKQVFQNGPWSVEYTPEDGARLDRLSYYGYDLVTTEPENFRPPSADYGTYELRPVYGYDDCFPSVEACRYPGTDWMVPDHGEICWLAWDVSENANRLVFTVNSRQLPFYFKREMIFSDSGLTWIFNVTNRGNQPLPFQHVIHPLMKLDEINEIILPPFRSVNDENGRVLNLKDPAMVGDFLLSREKGTACMLFLQNIRQGKMNWKYKNGLQLDMLFPLELFPTMGIWWNNSGYPDEEDCRRNECAFEPVPGTSSDLSASEMDFSCLKSSPGKIVRWQIEWRISSGRSF